MYTEYFIKNNKKKIEILLVWKYLYCTIFFVVIILHNVFKSYIWNRWI